MNREALYTGPERRASPRSAAEFPARWEADGGRGGEATVTDLGEGGCFVISDEVAGGGELLRLDISPPGVGTLTLWGHVVDSYERTGFSVRFVPFSQGGAAEKLRRLILNSG
jgi:hypothetical protein